MRARIELGSGAEFDRIRAILADAGSPGPRVSVGPGDDALVLEGGTVLTVDISVEDVHFRRSWLTFEEIGYRAAVSSLSDLAAMAATPVGVLVSLAVHPEDARPGGPLEEVAAGARAAVEAVGGALLGGDLSASPGPLVVDVVAVGHADQPVQRTGSIPGDRLWVTGRLGGAAGAVRAWEGGAEPGPELREAFARPSARISESAWLREKGVLHAMIDVSDGIRGDAGHLAAAGGVALVVDGSALPLHPALSTSMDAGSAAECGLGGGEDYEILFTAAPGVVEPIRDAFVERFRLDLTPVGRVEKGAGVRVEGAEGATEGAAGGAAGSPPGSGKPTAGSKRTGGFDHFADSPDGGAEGGGGR